MTEHDAFGAWMFTAGSITGFVLGVLVGVFFL